MKKLNTLGKVITKILEVFHWVGVALMIAAIICSVAAPNLVGYFVGFDAKECCGANLEVYGFEINAPVVDGKIDTATFVIFGIGSVIILALMAMVFRNLNKIFKKSENTTPFQKDNVRLVREIGIFISNVNLSKIKNNKVTAIRFATLAAICEVLDCEAGDILEFQKED